MLKMIPLSVGFIVLSCAANNSPIDSLPLLDLWANDQVAFGVFVPNEQPQTAEQRRARERPAPLYTVEGGRALAENPLLDYVFLNLEGGYDAVAVKAIAEGLTSATAVSRKALLVRIPSIEQDGEDVTRQRVAEVMAAGADGIVFPHVTSPEQARIAVSLVQETGADIWSPANPTGTTIAMIMIEDPDALARVTEFADVPGISVLACGIGSLTRAMGGDRELAEAGNLRVLSEAQRVGVADMITANSRNVEQRIEEGFPALLMQGPTANDVIRTGRAAAGRSEGNPDHP